MTQSLPTTSVALNGGLLFLLRNEQPSFAYSLLEWSLGFGDAVPIFIGGQPTEGGEDGVILEFP